MNLYRELAPRSGWSVGMVIVVAAVTDGSKRARRAHGRVVQKVKDGLGLGLRTKGKEQP